MHRSHVKFVAPSDPAKSWRPATTTLQMRMVLTLLVLDISSIALSFSAAGGIRDRFISSANWAFVLLVVLPIYVITAINLHGYTATNVQRASTSIKKSVLAFIIALCAVIIAAFALKTTDTFPRLVVFLGSVFAVSTLSIVRFVFAQHLERIIGGNPFSVVLLCDGDAAIPDGKFSIVIRTDGVFDPDRHDPVMYDRLAASLQHADRVIVTCNPLRRVAWSHALQGANIQGEIFVPELDALAPLGMTAYGGKSTLIIANGPLRLVDRLIKRGFDVLLASVLLVLLVPLMTVIAILIKRGSEGPVFFTQARIGRGNQIFAMRKFRSMRVETADGSGKRSTARDDDRVTPIGRFIRRTSIDELPQLLNVLSGDMSIVGPRPHAIGSRAADKLFWEVNHRYWHRHAAKPGLTGLAQVRGYRGATLVEEDLEKRLQADLEYLKNWSIWRDIKIVMLTFFVLIHPNAY